MRDLLDLVDAGNAKATLAIELFVYSILKYIGSYTAVLPRIDAIVLTGGIGENSLPIRERLCKGLANLGVTTDVDRNLTMSDGKTGPITANGSELPVWVIPTNEELMIARDTRRLVAQG
jgi:acetate kinase